MDKETEPEKTGRAVHTTTMQRANDGQTRATQRSLPYAPSYVEELVAILEALTNPAITHLTLDNLFTMVLNRMRAIMATDKLAILLLDEGCSDSEVKDFATDISLEVLRLNRMITDMLDLERMKSGKMLLCLQPIDLNMILVTIVERTRTTKILHPIQIELDTALPAFEADLDKITQVIINLLSNAVKYSPDGGQGS